MILTPWPIIGFSGFLFWSIQGRLNSVGVSPAVVGVAIGCYFLMKALLAFKIGCFVRQYGPRKLLLALLICLVLGCLGMTSNNPWLIWLGGVLAAGFVHTLAEPVSVMLINREIPDHERATTLSIANMVSRLFGAGTMFAVTPLLAVFPHQYLIVGMLGVLMLLLAYPCYRLFKL